MAYFYPKESYHEESVPQGVNAWVNWPHPEPEVSKLFGARASIAPGMGHNFHYHPGREELIYVLEGTIEQWVGQETQTLTAGDAVVIPADKVHASFNVGTGPAVLFVVLTPAQLDQPLAVDVAAEAPWNSLRG